MTDNQQQGKPQELKWKNKFRDWLVNNLQFTSKSNVERIIDHVERYIAPSSIPTEKQKEEYPLLIQLKKWIEEQKIDCQKGYIDASDPEASTMYATENATLGIVLMKIDNLISSAPPISHKEDEQEELTKKFYKNKNQ